MSLTPAGGPQSATRPSTADKRRAFRRLHADGCFAIPNPWDIGSALYLQPELYVASSGGNFSSSDNGSDYSADVRFTTLNVPLLLGHSFGTASTNFRLMVGPVYSYLMNKDENFSQNFNAAYNDFGKYNNSTLGYQVGAGVDVLGLTADLRYEGGLSKLNQNYGQRANIWSISVGFKLL